MLALLFAPLLVVAEDVEGDAKKGAEIVDKFVEATGGKAAYEKFTNRYQKGSFQVPAMGLSLPTESWAAAPNLMYFIASSPELGSIERGHDGEHFWENTVMTGPRLLEGAELAEAKLEAEFDGIARWRDLYESAVYVGDDSVNGAMCAKVVMTSKEGINQDFYFDSGTQLLTKVVFISESPMGEIPIEVLISDYHDVDGIKFAFKSTISVMGQERIVVVDSLAHNVELPEGVFDMPADVLELMQSQDTTKVDE
jgi:hypothetical protein